jgi:hypothetical protein
MVRFLDPNLRLLIAGACLGLTVASCQLVVLTGGTRDMAYPGGVGEEMAVGSTRATIVGAETPVGTTASDVGIGGVPGHFDDRK